MNEFDFIRQYLAPLSKDGLSNDAAVLGVAPHQQLVVTTDTLIAGRHFLGFEPPELLAQKALRVNLSDLAAMGATPLCYNLAISFAQPPTESWAASFADGLRQDQGKYGLFLLGGDTTSGTKHLTITISMFGLVAATRYLTRSGADAGDLLYHSGELGQGVAGLQKLQDFKKFDTSFLKDSDMQKYVRPELQITLGQQLIGIASSCLDVSDGLAQDAAHIARQSDVQLVIETEKVRGDWRHNGDDYELLFTVPPAQEKHVTQLSKKYLLTKIGYVKPASDTPVILLHNQQQFIPPEGFTHF